MQSQVTFQSTYTLPHTPRPVPVPRSPHCPGPVTSDVDLRNPFSRQRFFISFTRSPCSLRIPHERLPVPGSCRRPFYQGPLLPTPGLVDRPSFPSSTSPVAPRVPSTVTTPRLPPVETPLSVGRSGLGRPPVSRPPPVGSLRRPTTQLSSGTRQGGGSLTLSRPHPADPQTWTSLVRIHGRPWHPNPSTVYYFGRSYPRPPSLLEPKDVLSPTLRSCNDRTFVSLRTRSPFFGTNSFPSTHPTLVESCDTSRCVLTFPSVLGCTVADLLPQGPVEVAMSSVKCPTPTTDLVLVHTSVRVV